MKMRKSTVFSPGAIALGLVIVVQVIARAEGSWQMYPVEPPKELKMVLKPPPKLPRPDDLKLNPDGQIIFNPEVYQLVYQNVDRKGRMTVQLKTKQRSAPDGTKYQVYLNDKSPDAKFEIETKYLQLPYTPPKLPGPDDLKIDSSGKIAYNPIVYQLLNYTVDQKNLATIALKIKVKKDAQGGEYQVHLDDDDPDTFDKIVNRHLQLPFKPSSFSYNVTFSKITTGTVGSISAGTIGSTSTGTIGSTSTGTIGSASTGTIGSTSTGTIGSTSTGTIGSTSTGTIGSTSTGTIGSTSTGTIGSASTGKIHSTSTGTIDSTSTGKIGSTSTGTIGSTSTGTIHSTSTVTIGSASTGRTDSTSTFTVGKKPEEWEGNCGKQITTKNSTKIYNPSILNVPSYKQVNSSINPDGSRTIYGYIRVWSPIIDGPKYVVQYYPRPADSEKLRAKISVGKDGNTKITNVWYLNQTDLAPPRGFSTNFPRVQPDGQSPTDLSSKQKLEAELLIFNKIWYNIQGANKPGQPANVSVNVKLNPDGTRTVVQYNLKPSPGSSIWTGVVVPGPNRTESAQLIPDSEINLKVEGNTKIIKEKPDKTGSSGQRPLNPNSVGVDRTELPTTPNLYNIPSYKELYSSTAPDGSRIIHVHIRVYQPISNSPWYTVNLNSKLPNTEKLRAKIIIERDGTAKIRQIWCQPQDQAVHEICKGTTAEKFVAASEKTARKPAIDLYIQNKPWFQLITNKTNPNDSTSNRVIVWLKTAENPNGTYVVLPLDSSTPGAVFKSGFLEERRKNQQTFTWESVQYVKTVSTKISSAGETTSTGWSYGSINSKKDSSEEETIRKSQREIYEYPDETPTDRKTTIRDLYFYPDEDQPTSPRPLRKTPDHYVYPDENQTNSPGLFRTTQRDVYVYKDENEPENPSPFRSKPKDTYVYEDQN